MMSIEYYRRNKADDEIRRKFSDSFDANKQLCRDLSGDYEVAKLFSGGDSHNKCTLQNSTEILGWKNSRRFDVIDDNKDLVFDADVINSHKYSSDDETFFRWGVPGVFSDEEGIHGSVTVSKKRGLDSVSINEYKNHTDSPFFTIYNKKVK